VTLGTGRIQAYLNWCGTVDVDSERLRRHESGEQKTGAPSRRNQAGRASRPVAVGRNLSRILKTCHSVIYTLGQKLGL